MASKYRFEFPPEVVAERAHIFDKMRGLLAEDTLPALQQACRLQVEWLHRYPDDYVMADAGELLGMSESALTASHRDMDVLLIAADERLQEA